MRQKKGECLVWGKPPTLVRAKYTTTAGEERESDSEDSSDSRRDSESETEEESDH